ncbi:MAG TPA: DbpA RNA binding domain-containing protein, partial [Gemmatimonadales bacterium]
EDSLREELRAELAAGAPSRELLTLEPLLADHDGIELAAALLRMLEQERRARPARQGGGSVATSAEPASRAPWTRLYVNVGTTDNAGAGDILGAIAGEADVPREKIGRIDLRDNYSLVDVATDVAAQVVERASGAMIRGRRLTIREDKDRAVGAPPPQRRGFGDRPERGERFERGARGDRPERGGRFDRGDRPDRGGRFERGERPQRGRFERGGFDRGERPERGERPDRGARPDRGGRGERPGGRFERGDRPFRGARDERRDSYGRTLQDEQREWAQRGDRMRNARRPRPDERE